MTKDINTAKDNGSQGTDMNNKFSEGKRIKHWHMITFYLVLYDIIAIAASYFGALWLRFDCAFSRIELQYLHGYYWSIIPVIIITIVVFVLLKLYKSIWRFASYRELYRLTIATGISLVLNILVTWLIAGRMPITYYAFGIVIQFVLTVGVRFSYRFVLLLRNSNPKNRKNMKNCMIIGAGAAGRMLVRDMLVSKYSVENTVCFIDDNPNKWSREIDGIPVVGGRNDIMKAVEDYDVDKIYVTLPSIPAAERKIILNICKETGCEIMNLPAMYQLYTGKVSVSNMKEVAIEDLLGREPINIKNDDVKTIIKGKRVLVTGGGGSIGSELCRQIACNKPELLVIFDIYENNAYAIQQELKKTHSELKFETIIGSVRDSRKIWDVFETYKPQITFHAAAHKHVPLMEDSPAEAVKNNVIGTYKTAYAAMVHHCERFVLISTDKAVNPTNIMGASKRMCEMVVQAFDRKIKEGKANDIPQIINPWKDGTIRVSDVHDLLETTKTEFVAVRFGNVLGSNGSVIPLFKKQIAEGGPVTVTHKDIIRYFMTIPEAVSLVLQAGTYANGGEIFVLDMGEPVKIDDLARNLIKLTGKIPDVDIMIEYTGLRPGEKLYEEKLMAEEGLQNTANDLIHIGNPIPFHTDKFFAQLVDIDEAAYKNKDDIRDRVGAIVTTYNPNSFGR